MERELDLRPYIGALTKNWLWIILFGVIAALLALAATYIRQPQYVATALVAVSEPPQIVQFDPRIQGSDDNLPFKAYPELATSDELLVALLDEAAALSSDLTSLEQLREILTAGSQSEPSFLHLSARFEDPQVAAAIANKWAELFVTKANSVFSFQGDEQLSFFESELGVAEQQLDATSQELIDFEARNRSALLEQDLADAQNNRQKLLDKRQQLAFLLEDIDTLKAQMSSLEAGDSFAVDQLGAVLLQVRAFSGELGSMQLQLNVDQIEASSRADQIGLLNALEAALSDNASQIDAAVMTLDPEILGIQKEIREANTQAENLNRDHDIAKETYLALAHKVQEERIASQETNSGVRLASRSAVPEKPAGSSTAVLAIAGGILGIVLATTFVLLYTWWRLQRGASREETSDSE